ncbi:GGDEF domain-containing phosphodiesterase [Persephonella sp.]|uniref:EAL domain-containing protein n=1 Tax=Persephonella sp. TaxID=2060922 RepID=UPI0025F605C2|nr:GGDEF domain-containing phosphodiesterase [Persephonella sp.]
MEEKLISEILEKVSLSDENEFLENIGKDFFENGITTEQFLSAIKSLENQIEKNKINLILKGYLFAFIKSHKDLIISVHVDLENIKEDKFLESIKTHLIYLLHFISSIEEESYNAFKTVDEKNCPLIDWLNSSEVERTLKSNISLVKKAQPNIHRLINQFIRTFSEENYYKSIRIYIDLFSFSAIILLMSEMYAGKILVEKKNKLQDLVRKLRALSEQDVITKIHNDLRLFKILRIQMRLKREFYISVFDIDDFKFINQVYGFKIGNLLLKEIARVFETFKSKYKILNFKTGSNSFVSLIFDKNAEEIIKNIKSKIENIELEVKIEDHSVKFYPKLTVAYMKINGSFSSPDEVLEILDIVLHRGKTEKKGSIVEYDKNRDSKMEIAKLLDKQIFLGYAIKENKIIPYFQPIFDLKNGEILGFEALFRIEKNKEIYTAGEFIDIAYKTGLIVEIDKLMIEYMLSYGERIGDYFIFLNISPQTIKETWFLEKVKYLKNCIFEITEQMAFDNIDKLKMLNLETLNKMALDDFGSGYSSIKTVVELSSNNLISFLKIDGSIIKEIDKNKESFFIVESIVKIAKTLGLKTIAEFIENERILKIIKNLDIDYAQGFYLGKPSPINEIKNYIHKS